MLSKLLKKYLRFSTAGPALTRFYLLPHVKLHYIHSSDAEFHNHPWNAFSIIFGSYTEFIKEHGCISWKKKRFFNYIPAGRSHRVMIKKPVWTIFINGPRVNEQWHYGAEQKPWEGSDQERNIAA